MQVDVESAAHSVLWSASLGTDQDWEVAIQSLAEERVLAYYEPDGVGNSRWRRHLSASHAQTETGCGRMSARLRNASVRCRSSVNGSVAVRRAR